MDTMRRGEISHSQETGENEGLEWKKYYAGEMHAHSSNSDREGEENGLPENVIHDLGRLLDYASKLGFEFVVFTEHGSNPGRPVKLTKESPICLSLLREKNKIESLNASGKYQARGFSAVEASIFFDENGQAQMDIPDGVLDKLDLVVASRHAIGKQYEPQKIKESLLAAINNPEVDIIGHPDKGVEFYEHDWNYFKKYWRKDPKTNNELSGIETSEDWKVIKQIIGKDAIGDDRRTQELRKIFLDLKSEYWQSWDEILDQMEKQGKAFEINLNTFKPESEFYRTLLTRASQREGLLFTITFDFHSLKQIAGSNQKNGGLSKHSAREKGAQRLTGLVSLLEELKIGPEKVVNSTRQRLREFISWREEQRNSQILSRSEEKKYQDYESMNGKIGATIADSEIEDLTLDEKREIRKLLIKYKTEEGKEFLLKKDKDYDMTRVYSLMDKLYKKLPDGVNKPIKCLDDNTIVYELMPGDILSARLWKQEGDQKLSARFCAELIHSFHSLDLEDFASDLNKQNYDLAGVRFCGGSDAIEGLRQFNEDIANELVRLYEQIIPWEKEILTKSKLCLVHGDMHPHNVLIEGVGRAKLIDCKNITLGVKERDLASMLEQVYAKTQLGEEKISEDETNKWQAEFIKSYSGEIDEAKLIFYRAWICWRNAVYCFSKYYLRNYQEIDLNNGNTFLERARKYLTDYEKLKDNKI